MGRTLSPTRSVKEEPIETEEALEGQDTNVTIKVESREEEEERTKLEADVEDMTSGLTVGPGQESPRDKEEAGCDSPDHVPPPLLRSSTSAMYRDDIEEFDDLVDDEMLEEMGEEFLERRFAEEQQRLEEDDGDHIEDPEARQDDRLFARENCILDGDAPPCPLCNVSLAGISPEEASTHVNNCLDGHPTPLPRALLQPPGIKEEPSLPQKRVMKAATPRPGQQNPFMLGREESSGGSAFSKLMSSHAEDAAWATAAANEVASRGKPAFKRTCPFYKILPGFSICVDAFRYGAVQGCRAYFLSHFHSDHYIGLTSSWCHGPIYCSKVTANLVKQQLRVNPKYVVALEFENKVEVPGTQGVYVTMISANHCPGSSLFLYEKSIGRNRLQRVLHCGDFRACPAHVQHPLLRPDVQDAVSGKRRGQKLDVCYLDTTYLTPKYAFPLQQEVIQACADMCISLSKDQVDETDSWERTKRERAGAGMSKFVSNNSSNQELAEDGKALAPEKKGRGRLLIVIGTYSIGKERVCLGIARAMKSKIYATAGKQRICAALEDPELTALLTNDPLEAQIHMQMIMEIRPETLADYLTSYKPHFSRIVGFRPSGWNYRPPNSRFTESPLVQTVLHSDNWKSRYTMHELVPQRGSTREASCFGVPYSEHSSFRELTMFCCALNIDKIIPTVNIGSAKSRERMKGWIEKWDQEKRKNGLFKVDDGATSW